MAGAGAGLAVDGRGAGFCVDAGGLARRDYRRGVELIDNDRAGKSCTDIKPVALIDGAFERHTVEPSFARFA